MNRLEKARQVLLLEAAAAECRRRAALVRDDLNTEARQELAVHKSAPTWRWADIGTMSLPVSRETVFLEDESALIEWVERNEDPDAVIVTVKRLRPWYVSQLLRTVHVVDGKAVDEDGTVIPGLGVRPGGVPRSLSFRPDPAAEDVAAQAAVSIVDEIAAKLGMSDAPS